MRHSLVRTHTNTHLYTIYAQSRYISINTHCAQDSENIRELDENLYNNILVMCDGNGGDVSGGGDGTW